MCIKGSRINYNAYRNKTELMETIRTWDSMINIRKKQQKYLKGKIAKFATKGKNKIIRDLYRGNNENEKVYQLKTTLVKNENDNLLAEYHIILKRYKKHFSAVDCAQCSLNTYT
jgi:tryptophanyl-tRNA synthetase